MTMVDRRNQIQKTTMPVMADAMSQAIQRQELEGSVEPEQSRLIRSHIEERRMLKRPFEVIAALVISTALPLSHVHSDEASLQTQTSAAVVEQSDQHASGLHLKSAVRRPIAMVQCGDNLYVAHRDTGSISIVDLATSRVLQEQRVAHEFSDLIDIQRDDLLLGVDKAAHRVVLLKPSQTDIAVVGQFDTAKYPVNAVLSADGTCISVASLWSRRITLFETVKSSPPELRRTATLDLPFAPLKQLVFDGRHALVTDAFGGQMAVIDLTERTLKSVQTLFGHNIRGLALSADRREVLLTHQLLNAIGATTASNISWGGVISNTLHSIPTALLLKSNCLDFENPERIHGSRVPLGEQGRAAGDPSDIATTSRGDIFVALAGVHDVGCFRPGEQLLQRAAVGRRPVAIHLDATRSQLLVLNQFDDSVSVLDPNTLRVSSTLSLGPQATRSPQQHGEELFFDARLSLDGWYSCHSCHGDGHSNGLLNDNFGDNSFGTPKHVLTLLGTGLTEPWAWNGTQPDLKNQIAKSIEFSMAGPGKGAPKIDDTALEALTTFTSLLPPAPGIKVARGTLDAAKARRGQRHFEKFFCFTCHQPPHFASPLKFSVGLKDEAEQQDFNPPSLRGVSQRGPYFHDNRAKRLRDVFAEHNHAGAASLEDDELDDLLEFLHEL